MVLLQTANLDGETNLKIRKAPERTWDFVSPDKVSEFKGYVDSLSPGLKKKVFINYRCCGKITSRNVFECLLY